MAMKNQSLSRDYIRRARHRLATLEVLLRVEDYADVVREAQETVELALKALLRHHGIEVPRVHDVSAILESDPTRFAEIARPHLTRLAEISRGMRRDRELSFYGSEDLTPSEFYRKADAERAMVEATWVVERVEEALGSGHVVPED
jgi:HEPN domain-containing protein